MSTFSNIAFLKLDAAKILTLVGFIIVVVAVVVVVVDVVVVAVDVVVVAIIVVAVVVIAAVVNGVGFKMKQNKNASKKQELLFPKVEIEQRMLIGMETRANGNG